ncbi:MAG: PilZ domain-containing protein [Pseudomonadota bacterium]
MMTSNNNQRLEERVNVALPIRLDGAIGRSRDVSAGGICFEVDANFRATGEIGFVIEMDASGAGILVKCKGSIVRTQVLGKTMRVAVKLTETTMESATN